MYEKQLHEGKIQNVCGILCLTGVHLSQNKELLYSFIENVSNENLKRSLRDGHIYSRGFQKKSQFQNT